MSELEHLPEVATGFPSTASDFGENRLDLNKFLVKHPTATYFMKMNDPSPEYGIQTNDILIVDRSIKPTGYELVIIITDGMFKLRQFKSIKPNLQKLESEIIWGVVTHSIRKQQNLI